MSQRFLAVVRTPPLQINQGPTRLVWFCESSNAEQSANTLPRQKMMTPMKRPAVTPLRRFPLPNPCSKSWENVITPTKRRHWVTCVFGHNFLDASSCLCKGVYRDNVYRVSCIVYRVSCIVCFLLCLKRANNYYVPFFPRDIVKSKAHRLCLFLNEHVYKNDSCLSLTKLGRSITMRDKQIAERLRTIERDAQENKVKSSELIFSKS